MPGTVASCGCPSACLCIHPPRKHMHLPHRGLPQAQLCQTLRFFISGQALGHCQVGAALEAAEGWEGGELAVPQPESQPRDDVGWDLDG